MLLAVMSGDKTVTGESEDDEALDILQSMVIEERERKKKSPGGESARAMLKSHAAFVTTLGVDEVLES